MEMMHFDELPNQGEEGAPLFVLDIFSGEGEDDEVFIDARGDVSSEVTARLIVEALRTVADSIEARFEVDAQCDGGECGIGGYCIGCPKRPSART